MKALVVGGTKGFGKEVSNSLLSQGVEIVTVSRSKKGFKNSKHYSCDLENLDAWSVTLKKIKQEQPTFDIILFIYGYANPKPFNQLTEKDWGATFSRNVTYISLALQILSAKKVVTIGSQWSYKIGNEWLVPYTVAKHALRVYTEDFAARNKDIIITHYCVPTMNTPGYRVIKEKFIELKDQKIIKQFTTRVTNPKKVACGLVNALLISRGSGVTFVIDKDGKVGKLKG